MADLSPMITGKGMLTYSPSIVADSARRPGDMPAINPRYLPEEADRRDIIGALRFARRIFAAPALHRFVRHCPHG